MKHNKLHSHAGYLDVIHIPSICNFHYSQFRSRIEIKGFLTLLMIYIQRLDLLLSCLLGFWCCALDLVWFIHGMNGWCRKLLWNFCQIENRIISSQSDDGKDPSWQDTLLWCFLVFWRITNYFIQYTGRIMWFLYVK